METEKLRSDMVKVATTATQLMEMAVAADAKLRRAGSVWFQILCKIEVTAQAGRRLDFVVTGLWRGAKPVMTDSH